MAQIEPSDKGGKKKKGAQKKIPIHVDFTPMVDMNMLLITFFMLCTTMIKSQTVSVLLPSMEIKNMANRTEVKSDDAFTMIVDVEKDAQGNVLKDVYGDPVNVIYYYEGKPDSTQAVKVARFQNDTKSSAEAIRTILGKRNKEVLEAYHELQKKYTAGELTKEQFDDLAQKNLVDEKWKNRPNVLLKTSSEATGQAFITAIDEMQINQIKDYNLEHPNHVDSIMIQNYYKTR